MSAKKATGKARTHTRYAYDATDVGVVVQKVGGGQMVARVNMKDISRGGCCFVHSTFLHTGSICSIGLPRLDGTIKPLPGHVAWCRYSAGEGHLIGVSFDQPIHVNLYVVMVGDVVSEFDQLPAHLHGARILLLDDQEMDRRLIEHQLQSTPIKLTMVGTIDEALAAFKEHAFDLLISDFMLHDGHTFDKVIAQFKLAGFHGGVLVVTAETEEARLAPLRTAGVDEILAKPLDSVRLRGVVVDMLERVRSTAQAGEIFSELREQESMQPLISSYVDLVKQAAEEIAALASANDLQMLRRRCQSLKGSGGGYGFPQITAAAQSALEAVDVAKVAADAAEELARLQAICRRLRA